MASVPPTALLFVLLCIAYQTEGHNQQRMQLECTQRGNVNVHGSIMPTGSPLLNRPGKMGPKGEVGAPGRKGSSGEVDYNVINREIRENVELECTRVTAELTTRLNKMEEKLLTGSVLDLISQGLCNVQYRNHCFWTVFHTSYDINMDEARRICAEHQGLPANIYNGQHLNDLMADIRRKISSSGAYFWTGMKVDVSTNAVLMRDGSSSPYTKWRSSSFPDANEAGLYIAVHMNPSDSNQGMGNDPPTNKCNGVICEK